MVFPDALQFRLKQGAILLLLITSTLALSSLSSPPVEASSPDCGPSNWIAGANLTDCDLTDADLTGVDLTGATLTGATLTGATLTGATLTGATLTNVVSGGIDGTPLALPTSWQLTGGYLVGPSANLTGADFTGANLTSANLTDAGLDGANLTGADLTNANLTSASLGATIIETSIFTNANFSGIFSRDLDGNPSQVPNADWNIISGMFVGPGANLTAADLTGADLEARNLRSTNFTEAFLEGADLSDAILTNANFTNAHLSDANFSGATTTGVTTTPRSFYNTRVGDFKYSHVCLDDPFVCHNVADYLSVVFYDGPVGHVSIPEFAVGLTVAKVGQGVFNGKAITSVTFPASMTSIDDSAFAGTQLTALNFPPTLTRIEGGAFYGVTTLTGPLAFPSSLEFIGAAAFQDTPISGALTIPDSVSAIGNFAFNGTDITGLTLGSELETIGVNAFNGVPLEGNLVIPNSVRTIDAAAFYGTGLDGSLTLGSSLESIGPSAFSGSTGFTGSLTIPASVTSIGASAFESDLDIDNDIPGNAFSSLVFEPRLSTTTIGELAFKGITTLRGDLTLQPGTTTVGRYAFERAGFDGILTLPESLTAIPQAAFLNTSFTSVVMGNETTSIDSGAFENVPLAGSLVLPDGLLSIGQRAFYLSSLSSLTIPESVNSIGPDAFGSVSTLRGSLTLPPGLTSLGATAFYQTSFDGTLNIPSGITSVPSGAFYGNRFSILALTNSTRVIGEGAFERSSIEEVTFPDTFTTIESRAFAGRQTYSGSGSIDLQTGTFTFEGSAPAVAADAFQGSDGVTVRYPAGGAGWSALRELDPNPFGDNVNWVPVAAPAPEPTPAPDPGATSPSTPPNSASASSTLPQVNPSKSPQIPALESGTSNMTIGGQVVQVEGEAGARGRGMTLSAGPLTMTVRSEAPDGRSVPLAADGSLILARSGEVPIEASGLQPGSVVTQTLFSDPIDLGSAVVDASGVLSAAPKIPANTPLGNHTLSVRGTTNTGDPFTLNIGVTVATPAVALGADPVLTIKPAGTSDGPAVNVIARGVQARCMVTFTSGKTSTKVRANAQGLARTTLTPVKARSGRVSVTMRVSGKGCEPITVQGNGTVRILSPA